MSDAFFEKLFGDSEPTHLGSGWVSRRRQKRRQQNVKRKRGKPYHIVYFHKLDVTRSTSGIFDNDARIFAFDHNAVEH